VREDGVYSRGTTPVFEPERETCARKHEHEEIVADGEFMIVAPLLCGLPPRRTGSLLTSLAELFLRQIARSLHTPGEEPRARTARVIAMEEN
jgi:hypothetical protein